MIQSRLVLAVIPAVILALCLEQAVLAGPPTDQLKPAVDRVIKALEDQALRGEAKSAERRQVLLSISDEIFDWREMAKRALGRHWQARTEEERNEFVGLFRDLLERSYVSTIERYSGEKISYVGDTTDGNQATVRTKVITKQGQEVPIEYRMIRQGDRWLVFDVVVENVSLVSNYRTQFNRIIQTSSYRGLLEKLKNHEFVKKPS